MVSWVNMSLPPQRHLDRFIRFCMAHGRDQQTHTQLDRPRHMYTDIAVRSETLPRHYGNSHAMWDHTVLPATRQR